MERTYGEAEIPELAATILADLTPSASGATVLALQGDLGAGKTTLTKTLAKELGIEETVVSPTFVIAKYYHPTKGGFQHVMHIDAYRIESLDELGPLGWDDILEQPNTLIIIEWPEKIEAAIPASRQHYLLTHTGDQRTIKKL